MPTVITQGAATAQGFGFAARTGAAVYVEDVFSTYLYTGNGSTQTITNGIDLSTKGGMVWLKSRSAATNNFLFDTSRGVLNELNSNTTDAQTSLAASLTAFNTTGFSLGAAAGINVNAATYASWTFRKQAKFFDVVTYTGNGVAGRTVAHNLGSVPGCIIVKSTDVSGFWRVYHRSIGNTGGLSLSQTTSTATTATYWNNTSPTSTEFTLGDATAVNGNGGSFVAYLFAHDAGGFGLTGTDNVISCGSFVADNYTNGPEINLGWEPQWLLVKNATNAVGWITIDNMRGFTADGSDATLAPNSAAAEVAQTGYYKVLPTGFVGGTAGSGGSTNTFIYIAIRRGPMKTPTSGTDVYKGIARNGTGTNTTVTGVGFTPDLVLTRDRGGASGYSFTSFDRLRGAKNFIITDATSAENGSVTNALTGFDVMDGYKVGTDNILLVVNDGSIITECFRRAPGFFDEVCYTGTGTIRNQSHNLQSVPEFWIVKIRNGTEPWVCYHKDIGGRNAYIRLDAATAKSSSTNFWGTSDPTASTFGLNSFDSINGTYNQVGTYVAYLFASCPGVSKVGSYTGTGTTKQIDCGFTGGARFVLIKRTDSTGDWYVWDSARGIVAGNDPYLLLNSTAAEVTGTDYIDTYSAGFEISSTAPAAINANGGTFIFLAIA